LKLFLANAESMGEFQTDIYGPVFAKLLTVDRRRALNGGAPETGRRSELSRLSIADVFAHVKVVDEDMAACCLAGVWLLHDFLDESHTISQGIDTTSGSYWHAIMHRREGDFSNAKYWLRRVGRHSVVELVNERTQGAYEPFAFVDRCERALHQKGDNREACLDIQQAEWESLFDYCYRMAVGR